MKLQTSKRWVLSAVFVLTVLFSFGAGNVTGYLARPVLAADAPGEFAIFWEAWDLVLAHFVDRDKIDYNNMTYGAIQGMLDALGDTNHTVFFPPEVAKQESSSLEGSFEGIGAYVSRESERFTIVAPIHGSPAEAAGILAGDIVLAVDGEDITELQEWEVIGKIRGPAGTPVTLTVLHPDTDEPTDVAITRGRIEIDSVLWSRIPGTKLVYLQITQFAADTSHELRTALQAINEAAAGGEVIDGMVLDLRNNPGGYLQEAIQVGNQFLDEGQVILHERDAEGNVSTYDVTGNGLAREIPMIVLINEGSASAAEILAGALRDNGRARLVGQTTLGTGTVLQPFTLSDGSLLRLGVTNWLTPNMALIKDQGIQPDVKIEQKASVKMIDATALETLTKEEFVQQVDRQFNSALLLLRLQTLPKIQTATTGVTP
ncbi:MAG: S41 family peptidase [Chloroflexota bacterium]|nr:S41 family peptidase [Chloroflexota bacterium]